MIINCLLGTQIAHQWYKEAKDYDFEAKRGGGGTGKKDIERISVWPTRQTKGQKANGRPEGQTDGQKGKRRPEGQTEGIRTHGRVKGEWTGRRTQGRHTDGQKKNGRADGQTEGLRYRRMDGH